MTVISMDWSKAAARDLMFPGQSYLQSYVNVPVVGRILANDLKRMESMMNCSDLISNAHIIGFSLGAHVAGFAGHYLQEEGGPKLARISGKVHSLSVI